MADPLRRIGDWVERNGERGAIQAYAVYDHNRVRPHHPWLRTSRRKAFASDDPLVIVSVKAYLFAWPVAECTSIPPPSL